MQGGFTKLFRSMMDSTIWQESDPFRILWVTMLAMADQFGEVHASVPGLAHEARISMEHTLAGLKKFQSPDPYSRTKDNEGRRISEIDGGWKLLNHGKYRAIMSAEERREYFRKKKEESRKRLASKEVKCVKEMSKKSNMSKTVKDMSTMSTHAEAEAEAEAEAVTVHRSSSELNSPNCSSVVLSSQKTAKEEKADEKAHKDTDAIMATLDREPNYEVKKKNVEEKKPKSEATGFNPFALWIDANRELKRVDPLAVGNATSAAKRIAALVKDAAKLKRIFKRYLLDQDSFVVSNGHSLALLESRIEKYRNDPPMPTDERMMSCDQLAKLNPACVQCAEFEPEWKKGEFAKMEHPRYIPGKIGYYSNGFMYERIPGKVLNEGVVPQRIIQILRGDAKDATPAEVKHAESLWEKLLQ